MATFSPNGKRLGRPPKAATAAVAAPIAKPAFAPKARYDAAGQGRRMAGWNAPSTGPNVAITGLQTIRNRARDASRNDWSGESTTQKWATALVGIAITPRFRGIVSEKRRAEVTLLWNRFVKMADADCVLDHYGQQTLATRSWIESGEVFLRRRARFADEGLPVPLQVQVIEADMCPLMDVDSYIGLPAGNRIRSGIELDRRGKRVAFWFFKEHPGDKFTGFSSIDPDALVRVAASEICHVFEPKRPGQLRGVSTLAPVLARLRNIGDYEDATLERQKIANLVVGFISRGLPKLDPNDPTLGTPQTILDDVESALGRNDLLPMEPGLLQELDDGQKVDWSNPPEAGTNYSDYIRTSQLGTAAAAGLPYELYSGDIANVSDRTLRVLINDFRRFAEQRQWQILIPQMCQKIVDWFADAALLVGLVSATELEAVKAVEHAPHGWSYIHPVQDVQGKALEVASGFTSRSSVISARGDDPETVDRQRAADLERSEKLGLVAPVEEPPADEPPPDETEEQRAEENAKADLRMKLARIAQIEADTDALRAAARGDLSPMQQKIIDLLADDDVAPE